MSGRLYNLLASSAWAITEDKYDQLCEVYALIVERKAKGDELDRSALEKQLGRPLDNTRTATTRNGVATIPVEGTIFRRADLFTDISGATTVETLAQDFDRALNDSSVKAILFSIDSPGGEVNGINEFADHVFAARGQKPVVAYVSHLGGSAAYWIASACDEVVCDAAAMLGSIGVIGSVPDPNKDSSRRIKVTSTQSPKKNPDVSKESGLAVVKAEIDALAQVFIDSVARNRGVSPEKVAADFGQGGVLVGAQAVKAGLADRTGSYEGILAELQQGYTPKKRDSMSAEARATTTDNGEKTMSEKKGWIARFFGSLSEDERKEAAAELGVKAEARSDAKPDEETLRKAKAYDAMIEKQRAQRDAEATALVNGLITSGKALPAEFDALKGQFLAAAEDDEARPLASGSRVENLKAALSRTTLHSLTDDKVKGTRELKDETDTEEEKIAREAREGSREWALANKPRLQEVK